MDDKPLLVVALVEDALLGGFVIPESLHIDTCPSCGRKVFMTGESWEAVRAGDYEPCCSDCSPFSEEEMASCPQKGSEEDERSLDAAQLRRN